MDTVSKIFGVKPPTAYKVADIKAVNCSFPQLIMGLELETEEAKNGAAWYEAHLRGPWVTSTDGSLRGRDTAFEFISKPISLEYMIPTLGRFFETTKFTEKNYSDRCSVHVHTNVTDFTQEQLAALSLVYTVIEDVLFQFVNHYKAPTEEGYCRDTNIYCIPWSQCRANVMLVNKLLLEPAGTATHRWQKYTALNLLPIQTQGSVEWRHMHGTADMEKLTTWLNIIGSIVKFSKNAGLDDVVKTIKVLNDTSAYQQFFNSILQGYLPYNDTYRGPMADGVINAKNGLLNWELAKSKPKASKLYKTREEAPIWTTVPGQPEPAPAADAAAVNPLGRRARTEPPPNPLRGGGGRFIVGRNDFLDEVGLAEQAAPPVEWDAVINTEMQRIHEARQRRLQELAERLVGQNNQGGF